MADIFQEIEEDLRRDRYQLLARKYGGVVIAVALLVVAGTGGYALWKNWRDAGQQADTLKLAEAVDVIAAAPPTPPAKGSSTPEPDRNAAAVDALTQVAGHAGEGAAGLARFYLAGVKARAGDAAAAVTVYDAIARDGAIPPLYRDLAALLSIQLQITTGDPKPLAERLAALSGDTNPWHYSARELEALLAARNGDKARAKTLFQQLADDTGTPPGLRARAAELAAYYGKNS